MSSSSLPLSIGTAQFGFDYGVTNRHGKVESNQIKTILDFAFEHGVNTIDTANEYGEAETCLGSQNLQNYDLITKVYIPKDSAFDEASLVLESIKLSLKRLKINQLKAVLVHNDWIMLTDSWRRIYRGLQVAKDMGLCKQIGISTYNPENIFILHKLMTLDIMQAPLNPIDQRLVGSGALQFCAENNIEVHSRSIFLQGLLLSKHTQSNSYFVTWRAIWDKWNNWIKENKTDEIFACLNFQDQFLPFGLSKVTVGITSLEQLVEILCYTKTVPLIFPSDLPSLDEGLINPSYWNCS